MIQACTSPSRRAPSAATRPTRAATLAGIFTNSVFGVITPRTHRGLEAEPGRRRLRRRDAVTYVWLGQAMIMTVALWGGGTTEDLAERIRSGDVAIDFYRPVGILGWYLAGDVGRAAYHLLSRGSLPRWSARCSSTSRYPAGRSCCWRSWSRTAGGDGELRASGSWSRCRVLAPRHLGHAVLAMAMAIFFSGMTVPLVLFPGWFGTSPGHCRWRRSSRSRRHLARQGTRDGLSGTWASRRLGGRPARLLLPAARPRQRKVVVQGG